MTVIQKDFCLGCNGPRHPQAVAAQEMMDLGSNALFCASFKDLRLITRASHTASTAGSTGSCLCPSDRP